MVSLFPPGKSETVNFCRIFLVDYRLPVDSCQLPVTSCKLPLVIMATKLIQKGVKKDNHPVKFVSNMHRRTVMHNRTPVGALPPAGGLPQNAYYYEYYAALCDRAKCKEEYYEAARMKDMFDGEPVYDPMSMCSKGGMRLGHTYRRSGKMHKAKAALTRPARVHKYNQ